MKKRLWGLTFVSLFLFFLAPTYVTAGDTEKVIQASEILEKIERGEPAIYKHAIVKGQLDLKKVSVETAEMSGRKLKVIRSKIAITSSVVENAVDFSNALFDDEVDFEFTEFRGLVWVSNSYFRGEKAGKIQGALSELTRRRQGWLGVKLVDGWATTEEGRGRGGALVTEVIPDSPADSAGVKTGDLLYEFNGQRIENSKRLVVMVRTTMPGDTVAVRLMRNSTEHQLNIKIGADQPLPDFFGTESASVSFFSASFKAPVFFTDCHFKKVVTFSGASFDSSGAVFQETIYEDDVFFMCDFKGGAQFGGAVFKGKARFGGADFLEGANFRGTDFRDQADFESARIEEGISFGGAVFHDRVDFSWIECDRMDIDWDQIKGKLRYDKAAFAFIKKNFENLGKSDDADGAYYEYRTRKRKLMNWYSPVRLAEFVFLDLSCGYGTRPFQVIGFSLVLVLLFAFCFFKKGAVLRGNQALEDGRFGYALFFSVNTFTRVGHSDLVPSQRYLINTNGIKLFSFGTLAMIEGFLGWVMLSLFLITLARTWIR